MWKREINSELVQKRGRWLIAAPRRIAAAVAANKREGVA